MGERNSPKLFRINNLEGCWTQHGTLYGNTLPISMKIYKNTVRGNFNLIFTPIQCYNINWACTYSWLINLRSRISKLWLIQTWFFFLFHVRTCFKSPGKCSLVKAKVRQMLITSNWLINWHTLNKEYDCLSSEFLFARIWIQ